MATNGTNHNENLSKDEVGWYFVEQYYTTLSKNPSRLHLFYGKKSQLVYGLEAEVAIVSVGRQDIQERIVQLDFQDCKVRVSNVDTQASLDNIVIQVIGEISNKSEEPRKFVQTFILAEQPSGYFVLNDILRYIKEEEDEPTEAAATTDEPKAAPEEAKPEEVHVASVKTEESEAVKPQLDAAVVDKKLEEVSAVTKESPAPSAVATPVEHVAVKPAEPAPAAVVTPAQVPDPEKAAQEVAEEDEKKTEAPKEPSPTPVATRAPAPAVTAAPAPAEPEKPKGPPKPMTWASRAAAAAGPPRSVVLPKPAPAAAAASAPVTIRPAVAPAAAAAAPAPAAPATKPAATEEAAAPAASPAAATKDSGNEWHTAGADTKRGNRPQSISGPPQDKDTTLGYVKYVTEKVEEETLRNHLETFGPVVYFDINRTKNCAFIEFASPAGYQAAVAANPHTINGENILVEARRPKASAYGGANYNPNRGNIASRGRGGYESRNGSQGGGRGGFTSGQNRGRGGAGGASRGRGGAQNVTA